MGDKTANKLRHGRYVAIARSTAATGCGGRQDDLLATFAQLVHVLDGGLVDQGAVAAADLEGITVVPLDMSFDEFSVFEHDDHRRLGLNLLLEVEQLGLPL